MTVEDDFLSDEEKERLRALDVARADRHRAACSPLSDRLSGR